MQVLEREPILRLHRLPGYILQVMVDVFADTFLDWLQSRGACNARLTMEPEKLPLEAIKNHLLYDVGPLHLMERLPFVLGIKSNHPRLSFPKDSLLRISAFVMTSIWLEM